MRRSMSARLSRRSRAAPDNDWEEAAPAQSAQKPRFGSKHRQNSLERAELFVYKPHSRDMLTADGIDEPSTIDPKNYRTMERYEPSHLGRMGPGARGGGARPGAAAQPAAASRPVAAPMPAKSKEGIRFPWRRGSPTKSPT